MLIGQTAKGEPIMIEPSGATWSTRHGMALVASDNVNDLVEHGETRYAIVYFKPDASDGDIVVRPLLHSRPGRNL